MLDGTMQAIERKSVRALDIDTGPDAIEKNGPAAGCSGAKATRGSGYIHPPHAHLI